MTTTPAPFVPTEADVRALCLRAAILDYQKQRKDANICFAVACLWRVDAERALKCGATPAVGVEGI